MKIRNNEKLKKIIAIFLALLLLTAALPAALAEDTVDWSQLFITIYAVMEDGETMLPVGTAEFVDNGDGSTPRFWVRLPEGIPMDKLFFSAELPGLQEYLFSAADNSNTIVPADATSLDGMTYQSIFVNQTDEDGVPIPVPVTIQLYVSTSTDKPDSGYQPGEYADGSDGQTPYDPYTDQGLDEEGGGDDTSSTIGGGENITESFPADIEGNTPGQLSTEVQGTLPVGTDVDSNIPGINGNGSEDDDGDYTGHVNSSTGNNINNIYNDNNTGSIGENNGDSGIIMKEPAEPTEAPIIPVGELINRYGVTNIKVNFRKEPSTNAGKYGELSIDTPVYMIYTEDYNGEQWTAGEVDGKTGYIMTQYLNALTQEDSDEKAQEVSIQAKEYTLDEAWNMFYPAGEKTGSDQGGDSDQGFTGAQVVSGDQGVTGEQENNFGIQMSEPGSTGENNGESSIIVKEPAEPTEAPTIPVGELINRYGMTNIKVNFRKEPSTNAGKHGELSADTPVYMIYTEDYNGEQWTAVEVDGKTGYIMTQYLNALTQEDSDETAQEVFIQAKEYTSDEAKAMFYPVADEKGSDQGSTGEQGGSPGNQESNTGSTGDNSGEGGAEEKKPAEPTEAPTIPVGELINRYGAEIRRYI